MKKRVFVFILFIFLLVFSCVLLTGCDINEFLNLNGTSNATKYKITVIYLDSEEKIECKKGEVVTINSKNEDFGSWMINNVTVSYDSEFKFTVNKDVTVYEQALNEGETKDFCVYCYAYEQNGKVKLYCKFYNPNGLEVTKVGFLVSSDLSNVDKQIYNWNDLKEYVSSGNNELNEFSVACDSKKGVFVGFVETNNGENINVYHYSNVYQFNAYKD